MKKILAVAIFLSTAVGAAFAYPPLEAICHRYCVQHPGPVGSLDYQSCMEGCL